MISVADFGALLGSAGIGGLLMPGGAAADTFPIGASQILGKEVDA
jgi:hypothetical protein